MLILNESGEELLQPEYVFEETRCMTCSHCGRSSWGGISPGDPCWMPQPNGEQCQGRFF